MSYPTFPELSRRPALKTKGTQVDPTLRDTMENGMETARARFTRRRREWTVTYEYLTNADYQALENFVASTVVYGAGPFIFTDGRDPTNPYNYTVRFSKLPAYTDAGWIASEFRQNVVFDIREM